MDTQLHEHQAWVGPRVRPAERVAAAVGTGRSSSRSGPAAASLLVDLVLVVVAIAAAATLRTALPFDRDPGNINSLVTQLGGPVVVVWLALLAVFRTYDTHLLNSGVEMYKNVINASVITAGVVGIVCYLGKIPLSRGFFVLSFVVGIPLLVLGRFLVRRGLHRARRAGHLRHRVLIAGDAAHVEELTTILRRESWLGYQVVGALAPDTTTLDADDDHETATATGVPYLGTAALLPALAEAGLADSIIVAGGAFSSAADLRRALWTLEEHNVQMIVAPSVTDVAAQRVTVRPVAGLPLVHLERPTALRALRRAKRVFDLVASIALLVVFSPVMALTALAVKRHDGGPVLFRQDRVGRDGEHFSMLKFRSMVVDAEERLPELSRDDDDGLLFKMSTDPRITRPGRWMRRYSLDELPQLLHVVRGQMSLVGPRPALVSEVDRYDADVSRRLRVRPGMTGLWQVSGRSDLSWEDTVRLDLYYVDNWSLVQDAAILLKTLRAVVASDGAY